MVDSVRRVIQGHSRELGSAEIASKSVRRASVIAGVGLLLMAPLAIFGEIIVLQGLVTEGDATQTANAIANSEMMFRVAIVCLFLVAVLDIVVAWALFTVFEPTNRALSLLAAWFRIVYAGIFLVAASQLLGVIPIVDTPGYLSAFSAEQLHAQALLEINTYHDIWATGLIVFGLHLFVLGYLAYESGYVPRILGILLAIAGVGYTIDSLGPILSSSYTIELAVFTFVGEVVLIFWLLIKGRRLNLRSEVGTPSD